MLGPVDLDDWLDDDELSAILDDRSEIQTLRADAAIFSLRGWSARDFALARRFANDERLQSEELRLMARCLCG
jgi:ornithine cyclodeaminase/alanine dehydrogenase-like protein (mu-crystallin family)